MGSCAWLAVSIVEVAEPAVRGRRVVDGDEGKGGTTASVPLRLSAALFVPLRRRMDGVWRRVWKKPPKPWLCCGCDGDDGMAVCEPEEGISTERLWDGAEASLGGWRLGVAAIGESLFSDESGSSTSPGGRWGTGELGACPLSLGSPVARLSGLPGVEPMSVAAVDSGGGVGDLRPSAGRSRSTAW